MIAYTHQNPDMYWPRATIAVDLPTVGKLISVYAVALRELELYVGVARVHPEDKFVKKVGRELAKEKMKRTTLTLKHIEIREDSRVVYVYHLKSFFREKPTLLELGFSYLSTGESVRLEYAILSEG